MGFQVTLPCSLLKFGFTTQVRNTYILPNHSVLQIMIMPFFWRIHVSFNKHNNTLFCLNLQQDINRLYDHKLALFKQQNGQKDIDLLECQTTYAKISTDQTTHQLYYTYLLLSYFQVSFKLCSFVYRIKEVCLYDLKIYVFQSMDITVTKKNHILKLVSCINHNLNIILKVYIIYLYPVIYNNVPQMNLIKLQVTHKV